MAEAITTQHPIEDRDDPRIAALMDGSGRSVVDTMGSRVNHPSFLPPEVHDEAKKLIGHPSHRGGRSFPEPTESEAEDILGVHTPDVIEESIPVTQTTLQERDLVLAMIEWKRALALADNSTDNARKLIFTQRKRFPHQPKANY